MAFQIAVVGGSDPTDAELADAEVIGAEIAAAGAVVVCGGLGGVMEAACRGAKSAGGTTVGILPGTDVAAANRWVDVAIPTGMGEGRNVLVVRAAAAVIAVGGGYGTLSEISLALRAGTPVVGLRTWSLVRPDGSADGGVETADDPRSAAAKALVLAVARSRHSGSPTPPEGPPPRSRG